MKEGREEIFYPSECAEAEGEKMAPGICCFSWKGKEMMGFPVEEEAEEKEGGGPEAELLLESDTGDTMDSAWWIWMVIPPPCASAAALCSATSGQGEEGRWWG